MSSRASRIGRFGNYIHGNCVFPDTIAARQVRKVSCNCSIRGDYIDFSDKTRAACQKFGFKSISLLAVKT
jgi:hypothetical protein